MSLSKFNSISPFKSIDINPSSIIQSLQEKIRYDKIGERVLNRLSNLSIIDMIACTFFIGYGSIIAYGYLDAGNEISKWDDEEEIYSVFEAMERNSSIPSKVLGHLRDLDQILMCLELNKRFAKKVASNKRLSSKIISSIMTALIPITNFMDDTQDENAYMLMDKFVLLVQNILEIMFRYCDIDQIPLNTMVDTLQFDVSVALKMFYLLAISLAILDRPKQVVVLCPENTLRVFTTLIDMQLDMGYPHIRLAASVLANYESSTSAVTKPINPHKSLAVKLFGPKIFIHWEEKLSIVALSAVCVGTKLVSPTMMAIHLLRRSIPARSLTYQFNNFFTRSLAVFGGMVIPDVCEFLSQSYRSYIAGYASVYLIPGTIIMFIISNRNTTRSQIYEQITSENKQRRQTLN
ncbi:hypothetical protein DFA_04350 [Cavenderia fasciculata]|uniref:Transmembrane protein n=1 Tax=Cavenderia fasciculata TaxID=261658 RepID=F4PPB9_CACFS|nr:uncharacterized protein DFA_04350 [Cavenderia fasciculata]EGG22232.1 hypothetical protein DFA_04350 [Cavenderia fasciculata]|eukprot:XP_004360083.1 hypothetical protein DFA_04350 [Cavenderia fasciculata]